MPMYTYACKECGKEKEILHGIKEQLEMICCNKLMKKKIGSPMLEFRGHGFYRTDYKRIENIHKDAKEHIAKEDPSLY